jgi:hypothetical protein
MTLLTRWEPLREFSTKTARTLKLEVAGIDNYGEYKICCEGESG